uniref:Serine/arginine rich splicing factor n=1 Tax=Rhizophora mucronata TaxID=61149 RepID=A0A2P2L813_RHIMU
MVEHFLNLDSLSKKNTLLHHNQTFSTKSNNLLSNKMCKFKHYVTHPRKNHENQQLLPPTRARLQNHSNFVVCEVQYNSWTHDSILVLEARIIP